MPAGLDGNPGPIETETRDAVLSAIAQIVEATAAESDRTLISVDGRSGVGKSTFADELATRLAQTGLATLQRPEFRHFWNHGVLLEADGRLDERWLHFLLSDLPSEPSGRAAVIDEQLERARWSRYRDGLPEDR